jgi:hypothetical protein
VIYTNDYLAAIIDALNEHCFRFQTFQVYEEYYPLELGQAVA